MNGTNQGANSATFKSSTLSAGDYVKVVMTSNAKCVVGSPATSFQITLSSTAGTVSVSSNKDTICKGDTIVFTATPSDSASVTAYQWKINGTNVGNNSNMFSTANLSAGDSVWVEISANSSCGNSNVISNKLKPMVNAIPIISATITNVSCSGFNDGAALIGANGGKPNYSYSKNGVNFQPQNSFDNLVAGNYTFVVKDQNGCQAKIDTSVAAPPPITFVVDPDSAIICFGDSVKITAIGYNSFNWFNQTAGIKVDSNKTTIKVAPTTNSIYKVVSTLCGVSDSVKITVLDPVSIDAISDKTICLGDTISIKAKAHGGKGTFAYTWIPAPAFISAAGDSVAVIATSVAPLSFLLKAKNECPGYALNFKVFINPLPGIQLQSVNELCVGQSFTINNVLHTSKLVDYNWDFGDSEKGTTKISATHAYKNPGNYEVYLSVKDSNNCINSDTGDVIKVNETPQGVITYSPEEDLNTNTIVLFSASKSTGQVKTFYWDFENKGTSIKIDTALSFSEAGDYKVTLIVSNDKCADTTQKTLKVVNDFALFVPSSFSPNNDGVNDVFSPKGFGVIDYKLEIWNNWGELIFESNDFGKGWDGNIANGSKNAEQQVYVYKIKYKAIGHQNDTPLEKSGHLTLVR